MSEIEAFMASQELFRCSALCANITREACKINKKSGRIFSCTSCKGLGEKVEMAQGIKQELVKASTGTMVPPHKLCDFPGCNKFRVIGHKCTTHGRAPVPVKKEAPALFTDDLRLASEEPVIAKTELNKADLDNALVDTAEVLQEKQPVAMSEKSDIHAMYAIDLIGLFKQRQLEELDVFICELQKQSTPFEKLQYVYQILNS